MTVSVPEHSPAEEPEQGTSCRQNLSVDEETGGELWLGVQKTAATSPVALPSEHLGSRATDWQEPSAPPPLPVDDVADGDADSDPEAMEISVFTFLKMVSLYVVDYVST